MNRRHERGMILLSALILVTLATIIAAALFFEAGMSARRAAASFGMEQALQLGQGAEALAAYALTDDNNDQDHPGESWAVLYGPVEVGPGVSLEAQLVDLQGRFNLNMLVDAEGERDENAYKVLRRLLELKELDPRLAAMVVDWIDPDVQPQTEGGEDSLYMSQNPPHRTGNVAITSISELQQLPGFTREVYEQLAPHVTALPPFVRTINVCTADGVVLDALFAVSEGGAGHVEYSALSREELEERRSGGCFPRRMVLIEGQEAMGPITTERSRWFRLHSWINVGTAQFALYSLMYRDERGQVRSLARSLGTE